MAKVMVCIVLLMTALGTVVGAYDVLLGAYYDLGGDNLPPPWKVVTLCQKFNIRRVRLSEPNIDVLNSFRGMGIDLSFDVPNDSIRDMAANKGMVENWFNTYILPFVNDLKINYIIVGDKAIPGLDDFVLPVMMALQDLFNAHYLGQVKITTLLGYQGSLSTRDPPSAGAFSSASIERLRDILKFLSNEGSPLMVSVFPYREYKLGVITNLNYALFKSTEPVLRDGALTYYNMFDAMVDTFYAAIDKEDVGDVTVMIGETGWPTCGNNDITTPAIAEEYNKKFIEHISSGNGTPKRPNVFLEGFIQSLFNDDRLNEKDSQCFGMFDVNNMMPTYPLFKQKS